MKRFIIASCFALSCVVGAEAAPTDVVTQADLTELLTRLSRLEAENKAQAQRIAELEASQARWSASSSLPTNDRAATGAAQRGVLHDETTQVDEKTGIYTTEAGHKYYLADKLAGIFTPLSESGFKITPYGYLVLENVYANHGLETDSYSDWVKPRHTPAYHSHNAAMTMQDSILGLQFETPFENSGWTVLGRGEFDMIGDHANDYSFHWRHLYVDMRHTSGWSFLFGQSWHLWKMVTPSEIDGGWMENTGHPYRRSPQMRVTKKWNWQTRSLEWRFGVVKNGPGMGGDRDHDTMQDNSASPWPLFETAFLYDEDAAWQDEDDLGGKRWMIGLGGMYGRDRSHRVLARDGAGVPTALGEKEEFNSMLAMFATKVPFGNFTLTGQIFAGEDLGGVQAGIAQRVGFDEWGRGHEVRTIGGFVDLTYQLDPKWSFVVGYGFDNPNDRDARRDGGRLYNDRAYMDAFYRVTDNFKFGLEYARLSTKWQDQGRASADRFQLSVYYSF